MSHIISEYVLCSGTVKQEVTIMRVLRGNIHFDVNVRHSDLQGTSCGDDYHKILEANTDVHLGAVWPREPLRYIGDYCLALMKHLSPRLLLKSINSL